MRVPVDHPQRLRLHDEVHARPPESISTPSRLSYLALFSPSSERDAEWRHVCALARAFDVPPPTAGAIHYSQDFGRFRLKWERHTEFARYTVIVPGANDADPFADPAIEAVPEDWVASLTGEVVTATHVAVLREDPSRSVDAIAERWFDSDVLIGAFVGAGAARAFTDFRIRPDGFGRLLVQDREMTPRQSGRTVQRLLEIDTYRILATLALPVAQDSAAMLARSEQELTEITQALASSAEKDEPQLLDRLTRLAAEIEERGSRTHYRYGAADAYYDLVQRRIADLREAHLEGLQTFGAFIERRLAPAMSTCRSVAGRQESLSARLARATLLLSTRVDVTLEKQNKAVLDSVNRRAGLQLRLQTTVEGLSVVAVTYYLVGLVGYAAKAVEAAGLPIEPNVAMGVSIPVIAVLVTLGIHRIRREMMKPR